MPVYVDAGKEVSAAVQTGSIAEHVLPSCAEAPWRKTSTVTTQRVDINSKR